MNKILNTIIVGIILLACAGSTFALRSPLFYDNFESGSFNGWSAATPWAISISAPLSGTYDAIAPGSASAMLTQNISTLGYNSINVSWLWATNRKNAVTLITEWYNGTGWIQITNITGTVANTSAIFTLPTGAANNPNFLIGFNYTGAHIQDWGKIDNVNITGNNPCNYTGTGNWDIPCDYNCGYTTTININGNITLNGTVAGTGSGEVNITSGGRWNFTATNQFINVYSGCTLNIYSGGQIG